MAKVAVMVIHGIGDQGDDFADEFIEAIRNRVDAKPGDYLIDSCHWADVLQTNQNDMIDDIQSSSYCWQLFTRWVKKKLVTHFSDATSYYKAYGEIHCEVKKKLIEMQNKVDKDCKFIVVAHSLGAMIMSDFIYDHQKPKSEKLALIESLKEIITFGANIPLFRMGFKNEKRVAISGLNGHGERINWNNFYSPFDLLGYKLHDFYTHPLNRPVIFDSRLFFVGPWWFTAISHNYYWEKSRIIDFIAGKVDEYCCSS
jgi:hypothetical protein